MCTLTAVSSKSHGGWQAMEHFVKSGQREGRRYKAGAVSVLLANETEASQGAAG